MLIVLEKSEGEFNEEFLNSMDELQDGRYIIQIRTINPFKTEREFQNEYFALIDLVRDVTGNSRYTIHEQFKKEKNIETTSDFSIQDWVDFIDAFRWFYYQKANIIL